MMIAEDRHSHEFWQALGRGEARVPRCGECARLFFPPMPSCPNCGSAAVGFETVSGRGRAYSWVTVHRALDPDFAAYTPYTLVTVGLEEEPDARLVGILLDGEPSRLRDGAPLQLVPLWRNDDIVPALRPVEDADFAPDAGAMMPPVRQEPGR